MNRNETVSRKGDEGKRVSVGGRKRRYLKTGNAGTACHYEEGWKRV